MNTKITYIRLRKSWQVYKFYTCSHCPGIVFSFVHTVRPVHNHFYHVTHAQNVRILKKWRSRYENGTVQLVHIVLVQRKRNRSTCSHCAGTTLDRYGSKTVPAPGADTKLAWIGGPKPISG